MKKYEYVLITLFLIVSIGFHFIIPTTSLETIEKDIHCIVYVEGLVEEEMLFDFIPTIEHIFNTLDIENTMNFNFNKTLVHKQVFYIPESIENKISLNKATYEQLITIRGIGEVTANKIIEYRMNTSFELIEDLLNISGIGYKTYLNIREFVCL